MREKEFTNCPICGGIPGTGGLCPNCGFDPGLRYSRYPSLSPLPDGAILRTRRAAWEDRTKGLLRCPKCGGIRFSVLLTEAALRCDACGEKLGQESILKLLPPELAESVKGKEQVDSGRTEEQTAANIEEPAIHWQEDERHLQILVRRGQKVVTGYTGKVENLVLPTDVTGIAGHAFEGCAGLKNILLPASLTMIGEDAFSGCGALERITLPPGITVLRENCFARCTRLREVILPEGLQRIERNAFCFCGSLKELRLPDSVEEIMEDAFRWTRRDFVLCASGDWIRKHRQSLEKRKILYIPEGELDKTSSQGDDGLTRLVELLRPERDKEKKAAEAAFIRWQEDPTHLQIQRRGSRHMVIGYTGTAENLRLPEEITDIGARAFALCTRLRNILLPAGVREIEESAFSGCSALERIVLPPGLGVLRGSTFARCSALRRVELPERLRRIEDNAFSFCSSLQELRIPDSVEELSEDAFRWTRRDFRVCASVRWIRQHRQILERTKVVYDEI